ncbi:MAG: 50S ribosomal protein L13 [Eubacteriaceae bacterium]|nr:50S ribosomal protein L13 [Eubacteriaceae bacterium]
MLKKTTAVATPEQIDRKWYVVDAQGQVLGRLASQVAVLLRGKNKPCYTPNIDTGDYVIIINADKVVLTGNKLEQKTYFTHSGYAGHGKFQKYGDMMKTKPEFVVEKAVKGMLPHNKLGAAQFRKLHVYAGSEHEQAAQKPVKYELV